ncbi:Equisetin synthetase [Penicillium cinerascens]|uniref:Equisetin synthetase n=1 Tax=Penicillium cinerascens TaxID=70096 RepID=A0A9W9MNI4_9EURO|nr:Equisetin synthetase [Penicillium cinerascens]KAJ5204641.1 Equisetin synthetase [Penicillium cinerascens]
MLLSEKEPIAIIGMACRFPGGCDSPSKLWDLIKSPRDLSKRIPTDRYDTTGFYHANGSQHGASDATKAYFIEEDVTRFDNGFFNIQPAEAEAIDPQQRLVMETVYDSLYLFWWPNNRSFERLKNIRDLTYTLQTRWSTLPYRKPIIATNIEGAIKKIDGLLADDTNSSDSGLATRYYDVTRPKVLGIFTGQGAQWPRMGAQLLELSPFASQRIAELQRALATLPDGDRPAWTLYSQLLANSKSSRLAEAALAQPLCTAVQIVLVDLLRAAGIDRCAVVGHSSGEIGAAYAAGFLSASNAIRVAYYRGLYANLAQSGGPGAMMAVGTSYEDAQEFCELGDFVGRIQVAARNSSASITLSGDEDVIEEAVAIFQDEGKFARRLRVDTAYHSTHMLPCAKPYLEGLARAGYCVDEGNGTTWFSSVVEGGHVMTKEDVQQSQYWVDNMTSAVLFEPAVSKAVAESGLFDMAVEFGPHPALKGPALDTIQQSTGQQIPYVGLLARNKSDLDELASALGYLWSHLGASSVDFDGFEKLISGVDSQEKQIVTDLPTYPFDHSRSFYSLTRTDEEISWRNVLRLSENSWLQGHALQGQSVFPAMGYISLAVEAVAATAGDRKLGLITLENVVIGRALSFDDENTGVETKITLSVVRSTNDELTARISCHSGLPFDSANPLVLNFSAIVTASFHEPESDILPPARHDEINLVNAEAERLYSQFVKLGYNYSSPLTGVRSIKRKMSWAIGDIEDESGDAWEDNLLVHPGWLDSAIQTGFAAYSHPHDNRLFTLCVPTSIRSVVINPYFFARNHDRALQYQTSSRPAPEGHMTVDIDIFTGGSSQVHPFVQFESIEMQPFATPMPRDDAVIYTRYHYRSEAPDATTVMDSVIAENDDMLFASERVAFFYLRQLKEVITEWERSDTPAHFQVLLDFASRAVESVSQGQHPQVPSNALKDSPAYVRSLIAKHHDYNYMRLLEAAGDHLAEQIRSGGDVREHLVKDGLLNQFYRSLTSNQGQESANTWYARTVAQITYRFPRVHILEIGGGSSAGSTASILSALGESFSTYTYTEISPEAFEEAQERLRGFGDRLSLATYDPHQPAAEQGLEEGCYDIVLASNSLYAAEDLDERLANARKLLRPGGYLVALEINTNDSLSLGTILGGLPEGPSPSRRSALSLSRWDALVRRHGFSGVDTHTPFFNPSNPQWFSVFVSQAVDDRVNSLRTPLSSPTQNITHLVVVGGRTAAVAQLSQNVCDLLRSRYAAVTRIKSLEELNKRGLDSGSSVLSLTELDEQFLETRTEAKIDALKSLCRHGSSILWVTYEARAGCPYSSIVLGLARVLRHEYPAMTLQLLDFDAATTATPHILAEALVRLELGARFKKEQNYNLLWSIEPENHYVNGRLLIPRLLPYTEANNRYNAYRRAVVDQVDLHEKIVVLEPAADGKAFELATVSPLRVLAPSQLYGKTVTLRVEKSLLQAIKIRDAGYFHLLIGTEIVSGQRFAALSELAVESRACVPVEWTVRLSAKDSNINGSLIDVATSLLAQTIIAGAPRFGGVVVHEASQRIKDALDIEAAREGVRAVFTTSVKNTAAPNHISPYIFIHERLPARQAQALLPRDVSMFIDFSSDAGEFDSGLISRALELRKGSNLPVRFTSTNFLRTKSGFSPDANEHDVDHIGRALKASWRAVTNRVRLPTSIAREEVPTLPLQDTTGFPVSTNTFTVVDWSFSTVQTFVRPIDHGPIFQADGTYLLVGLTGELGQSLCTWMVAHGAQNIVLTSRRPKVSQRFIDSCASEGAIIKTVSMDVTSRESVRVAHDEIRTELPPIIGVANGAMLMDDALFDDMKFESLQRTAPPKIEGSVVLDEFFYDTPLDFFILFTSLANVVGNTGQSAYIMANQFMAALAAHRRDVRGVAGSDMAISSIQGLGYFEHANHLDKDHFTRIGYRNVSEQDFLGLFAETVLAGRPSEKDGSEVCTGVSPFREGATLLSNPCFSHLLLHDAADGGRQGARGNAGKAERPRTVSAPAPAVPAVPTSPPTNAFTEMATSSEGSASPRGIPTPQSSTDTPLETPLDKPLDLSDVFKQKELSISALMKQHEKSKRKAVLGSSTEIIEPMAFGQKRFWFLHHYIEDPTTFNIAYSFKLNGTIRTGELARAVETVADRHEALRTRFFWSNDDTKTPMQGILSKSLVHLETVQIESEAQALEELDAMREQKWDLGDWKQLRLRLLSLSDTVHYLLMGTHHISMDGYSMNVLMLDINQVYNRSGTPLVRLADGSQARDFGQQQLLAYEAGKFQPAIIYYRQALKSIDLSRPVELLSFARSQIRHPLESYNSNVTRVRLDPQTTARLKSLARSHRSTSFHAYLAALQALLFRLLPTETTEKLIIGIADANQIDGKFMGSIGNFLNVLPLLFDRNSGGRTFGQAIEDTRNKVYATLEHSGLPFDLLLDELAVPRSNAYPPVCQIFMDYKLFTREQAEMPWAGCKVSEHKWHPARGAYDIALEIVEDRESALLAIHTQDALYSKESTDLLMRSYVNVLKEVVKQGGEKMKVEKLEKWDKADIKTALELGKGSDLLLQWPTVAHRIDEVIAQFPNNLAVKDGFGRALTYAALDEQVESIARALRERIPDQSTEQSIVGVFQTPSADWISSLIAILRVGAIYLPLDLKVSTSRLNSYVNATRPSCILVDDDTRERLQEIGVESKSSVSIINVSDLPVAAETKMERTVTAAQSNRPAYIIFTSGSTGEPKGIVVKHASFRAMVEGFVREWDITNLGRVVLQQFALTSDGSLKQIASAITTGGCLLVAPTDARGDPTELTRLMAEHNVTFTVATPSEYNMWFRFASEGLRRFEQILPNLRFYTTYGPTEASVSTMKGVADVNDPHLTVPIPGRVLPNYAVYILDEESRPVPAGVPGEIVIGGAGVGLNEYLNRPEATAKQFVTDPFAPHDKHSSGWGRMYLTGDYGRLNSRGLLAIEGRVAGDAQVKVRGFRVELAEIEGVIIKEAGGVLALAVVTLRTGEEDHDDILAAHVVIQNNHENSEAQVAKIIEQLRTRLNGTLPQYMVPAIIVPVSEVPLTAHGKVDRKAVQAFALPEVTSSIANQPELQQDWTPNERRLSDLWASVLPVHSLASEALSSRSNFFRAGGNSLLLVKLQAPIKDAFGDAPRLSKLMSTPEFGNMAILLENEGAAPDWDKEIALDLPDGITAIGQQTRGSKKSDTGLRILVTGATGSLGKQIIPHLAANERVAQIIILARPIEGRESSSLFSGLRGKIQILSNELPSLPADETPELVELDVILHIAADRNFWDGYGALKPVNVTSTKALAKMALRTGAKLHVLSSGALADYQTDDRDDLPRPDPAHGYVSSKWVAERYLASAARHLGLQVTTHRPTKTPVDDSHVTSTELNELEHALVRAYLEISPRLGVRPDFARLGGTFDVAPVDDVAVAIATAVARDESSGNAMRILDYPGTAVLRTDVTAAYAEELFQRKENKAIWSLPTVPALHWVGQAKRAGLFEWFITAQELVVTDSDGRRAVSKR